MSDTYTATENIAAVEENETVVTPVIVTAAPSREDKLQELADLVTSCGYSNKMLRAACNMTDEELDTYLRLQRINSGGTVTVAELIAETENFYDEILASPVMQKRIALLEEKGADFRNLAVKLSNLLGGDVVIGGVKYLEYRELLTHLVKYVTLLEGMVSDIAAQLAIDIPVDTLLPNGEKIAIPNGFPVSGKPAVYVLHSLLVNLKFFAQHSSFMEERHKIEQERGAALEQSNLALRRQTENLTSTLIDIRDKEESKYTVVGFVVANNDGFIGIDDLDERVSIMNLMNTHNVADAITFDSKLTASDFASRIARKYKDCKVFSLNISAL